MALLGFLGITATAGGVALMTGSDGFAPPDSWLDRIPLAQSWTLPGLVLGVGFGLGSLVVLYGVWRRPEWKWLASLEVLTGHHWSWIGTIVLGIGQAVWIALELVWLPDPSILQAVYGPLALAIAGLPFLPSVRRDLARRV